MHHRLSVKVASVMPQGLLDQHAAVTPALVSITFGCSALLACLNDLCACPGGRAATQQCHRHSCCEPAHANSGEEAGGDEGRNDGYEPACMCLPGTPVQSMVPLSALSCTSVHLSRKRIEHHEFGHLAAGKLKDLGNTVLGKFGMSLDNFKAVKDPNTGSYSINFQQ